MKVVKPFDVYLSWWFDATEPLHLTLFCGPNVSSSSTLVPFDLSNQTICILLFLTVGDRIHYDQPLMKFPTLWDVLPAPAQP
jgi:hypothetical protein